MLNRTQILLLLVTGFLLYGLFSKAAHQHDSKTPWNIQLLQNGQVYVFGLTPGKTSIQEANQILGHFASSHLYNTDPPMLLATHHNLKLGGEPVRLDLQYRMDELDLAEMQQQLPYFSQCHPASLSTQQEINSLNSVIYRIIYTSQKQHDIDLVEDKLGKADEIRETNPEQTIMKYHRYHLTVTINKNREDKFVFTE